jgi:hypothetical protein
MRKAEGELTTSLPGCITILLEKPIICKLKNKIPDFLRNHTFKWQVTLDILTAANVKISVFWDDVACTLNHRCMEPSVTFVMLYPSIWLHLRRQNFSVMCSEEPATCIIVLFIVFQHPVTFVNTEYLFFRPSM